MRIGERDAARAARVGTTDAMSTGALSRAARTKATGAAAVQPPPLDADAEPRANLWRYARFQIRDFVRERGIGYLALGLLGVAALRASYDPAWLEGLREQPFTEPEYFRGTLTALMAPLTFIGSLISTFGIVARDREHGYQRFLFSKPLGVTRYYLQSLVVSALGFLGATALILTVASLAFGRAVPVGSLMLYATGMFSVVGATTFLLSTLVRFDVGLTTMLSLASLPVSAIAHRWTGNRLPWRIAELLLPPLAALGRAHEALRFGDSVLSAIRVPLVYGAACIVAALAILRRRSIAN